MSYMGTKILVTGADGFIGSHLTEGLVSAGADVTALAQYNSFDSHGWLDDLPEPIRKNVNLVRGDVRDAAFIGRLVPGHEIVFHLAALIAIPHSYVAAAVLRGHKRARHLECARSGAATRHRADCSYFDQRSLRHRY